MRQQVAIQTNEPNKINLEENPAAQRIADNQLRDLEIGAAMQPREQNSSDNWTKARGSYFIKEKKKSELRISTFRKSKFTTQMELRRQHFAIQYGNICGVGEPGERSVIFPIVG